ncbi:uncharacterized protein LOC107989124 isoform X2 [Cynoglossus semilaevis]|uniref:uncharacterized protein LOC107989124 isoform X2 n=1 Tax=Cynoglossus semilaevis TaxID=244447 RepID=UPI0007DC9E5E|nr:uncharacterized protein LOC107989124 isoform X2 [Cynoglossus semilaevis]
MAERKRSAVWSYFTALDKYIAICGVCEKRIRYCGNTTNLYKHIKMHTEVNMELQTKRREEEMKKERDHQSGPGPSVLTEGSLEEVLHHGHQHSGGSTNNLHRHLRAVHPDVQLAVKRKLSESTPAPDLAPIDGDPDPTATTTLSAPCAPAFRVSPKKRKITIMDQVSALVSETVAQLGEMDAAMQAQEDARLQLLMEHEREMQNNLICQLTTMHDNIIKQNHERHLELVDRLLSRFPSSSSDS